jgi:hypothetical protein
MEREVSNPKIPHQDSGDTVSIEILEEQVRKKEKKEENISLFISFRTSSKRCSLWYNERRSELV